MKTLKISLKFNRQSKIIRKRHHKNPVMTLILSGRYVIDAKSIMGIFSLDLSKPVDLNIHADDNVEGSWKC